jgi:hypothetical protein
MSTLFLILLAAVAVWWMHPKQKKPDPTLGGRLVPRGCGFTPTFLQRDAIHRLLQRERDAIETHETLCYRRDLAKRDQNWRMNNGY